jgi:hypothetical protein
MLICNNCNTLNPDGTLSCFHCNMRNRFTYRGHESENTPPSVDDDSQIETCWNCGKGSGSGDKCPYCNIPLTRFRATRLPGASAEKTDVSVKESYRNRSSNHSKTKN